MAKSKHTFAKRQREIEKKRKAEEKRARRLMKKEGSDAPTDTPISPDTLYPPDTPDLSEAPDEDKGGE